MTMLGCKGLIPSDHNVVLHQQHRAFWTTHQNTTLELFRLS